MVIGSWKERKKHLVLLIRTVGQAYAEEDDFLEDYIVEQVQMWSNSAERLQEAINCFESLREVACGKYLAKERKAIPG